MSVGTQGDYLIFELLEKVDDCPELSDTDWLCDLAFAVDILTHMNELNVKLQGKDQFVHEMYTNISAFKTQLAILKANVKQVIRLFPHTGYAERGTSTFEKIQEITRRPAWRILPSFL